ncbi:MAG: SDR family oxidoreductase [Planctomycetota bacterium]
MSTRIIITGAEGAVGKCLVDRFTTRRASLAPAFGAPCEVFALSRRALDVRHRNEVAARFEEIKPDVVFNAAGMTDIERCEYEKWDAYLANRDGAEHQAIAAQKHGALLVYLSTDLIFDGMIKRPYKEEDPPNPLSSYGVTKLAGELATMSHSKRFLIVRTGWLYGPNGKNYVRAILDAMEVGEPVTGRKGDRRQPTYVPDLVDALVHLVSKGETGQFHAASRGEADQMTVAKMVVKLLKRRGVKVKHAKVDMYEQVALMPGYSLLDCTKLEGAGFRMRRWDEGLKDFAAMLRETRVRR